MVKGVATSKLHLAPEGMRAVRVGADYYPLFDWLRIVLALVVMFHHDGFLNLWAHEGNFAVQVFFALSGWLIGGILLNLSTTDLPRFYFNRVMRIWIPYFIAFAFLVGASLLRDPVTYKWMEFVFYKATFVFNLFGLPQMDLYKAYTPLNGTGGHFWSVNAEEQFYLLAPLPLLFLPKGFGRSILLWVCVAILAWVSEIYASIVFGVLAAVIANRFDGVLQSRGMNVAYGACIALCIFLYGSGWNYHLVTPFCAIAIVLLLAQKGSQSRLGTFVGGISYPLYLNHWIGVFVINAIIKIFGVPLSPMHHLLSAAVNIGIAASLYWWIDRKVLAFRPRIYTASRGSLSILLAYGTVAIGTIVGLFLNRSWILAS